MKDKVDQLISYFNSQLRTELDQIYHEHELIKEKATLPREWQDFYDLCLENCNRYMQKIRHLIRINNDLIDLLKKAEEALKPLKETAEEKRGFPSAHELNISVEMKYCYYAENVSNKIKEMKP